MEFVKSVGPEVDVWLTLEFAKLQVLLKLLKTLPGGTEQRTAGEEVCVEIRKYIERTVVSHASAATDLSKVRGGGYQIRCDHVLVLCKLGGPSALLEVDGLGSGKNACFLPVVAGEKAGGDERLLRHDTSFN